MTDRNSSMRKKISYVFLALLVICLLPVLWFVYEVYIKDHTISYGSCGEVVPISVSFSVAREGESLSCGFTLEEEGRYTIYLVYLHEEGKKLPNPDDLDKLGEDIALKYSITNSQGKLITSITSRIKEINFYDRRGYIAGILSVSLTKGKYVLDMKSLNGVPELRDIKTHILIMNSINVVK